MKPVSAIDLCDVIRKVSPLLEGSLGEDVRLVIEGPSELPLIMMDRGQAEQIILNLVNNARDAITDGGTIMIKASDVDLRTGMREDLPAGRYVSLSVTDTGGGIAPDALGHIFEPFFASRQSGRGTGLGLATVYAIVKRARGGIYVNSKEGFGTSFDVYLPISDGPA
ncbi:MAG: two-component system, cell cycle sensor histidine kinase and response regulator CckA [Actinomycetota bacterium]|jgi:signal transduction histidine kinase|nr:two-component system, cell cycle sensor histidine kinase and response regulator CckA [Actinomycetota bacterium]